MHEFQNDVLNAKWISRPFVTESSLYAPRWGKIALTAVSLVTCGKGVSFLGSTHVRIRQCQFKLLAGRGRDRCRSNAVCFARVIFLIEIT
jgi:hypothetical protein